MFSVTNKVTNNMYILHRKESLLSYVNKYLSFYASKLCRKMIVFKNKLGMQLLRYDANSFWWLG